MSSNFLLINDESISFEQVLNYLQLDGSLQPFLMAVLRQHTVAHKLDQEPDLQPTAEAIERRLKQVLSANQIQEIEQLPQWLESNSLTYEQLLDQVARAELMDNLIEHISRPKLHEYFIKQKQRLDKVMLSCIIVDQESLAEELHDQIKSGESFEQLAKDYSIAENSGMGGKMEPISPTDLPDDIRIAIDQNSYPGRLIGPIDLQNHWYLFRLEAIVPAALEGAVEAQLKAEIYQEWLNQEMAAMTIKTQVTQWLSLKTSIR